MELAALEKLIQLLRANGVTRYESGDVKLELGGGISVVRYGDDEDRDRSTSRPVDPELLKRFQSLPPAYQAAFKLGD